MESVTVVSAGGHAKCGDALKCVLLETEKAASKDGLLEGPEEKLCSSSFLLRHQRDPAAYQRYCQALLPEHGGAAEKRIAM